MISDGINAKAGTLTADWERYMPWRTVDGKDIAPKGSLQLDVLIKGIFERTASSTWCAISSSLRMTAGNLPRRWLDITSFMP